MTPGAPLCEPRRRASLSGVEQAEAQAGTDTLTDGEREAALADPLQVGRLWTGTPVAGPAAPPRKGEAPAHLVNSLWRPGQSGNPAGGPPSYRLLMRRRLKELAKELGKKYPDGEEEMLIAEAHLLMIMQDRSVPALREWLDREHGPVVQRVEQNLNVQDVTRAEFAAFMLPPRVVEAEPAGQLEAGAAGPDED